MCNGEELISILQTVNDQLCEEIGIKAPSVEIKHQYDRCKVDFLPFKELRNSSEKMPLGASFMRTHLRNCLATSLIEPGISRLLKIKI